MTQLNKEKLEAFKAVAQFLIDIGTDLTSITTEEGLAEFNIKALSRIADIERKYPETIKMFETE